MAASGARRYLRGMDHHHLATYVAISASMFASMIGAGITIAAGIWSAKHPGPRGFDFAASARRIRMRPIPAKDRA
jgi:hypothetical protein